LNEYLITTVGESAVPPSVIGAFTL